MLITPKAPGLEYFRNLSSLGLQSDGERRAPRSGCRGDPERAAFDFIQRNLTCGFFDLRIDFRALGQLFWAPSAVVASHQPHRPNHPDHHRPRSDLVAYPTFDTLDSPPPPRDLEWDSGRTSAYIRTSRIADRDALVPDD